MSRLATDGPLLRAAFESGRAAARAAFVSATPAPSKSASRTISGYLAWNSPLTPVATSSLISTTGLPASGPACRSAMPHKTPIPAKG